MFFLGQSPKATEIRAKINKRDGNGNPLQCSCLENPRDRGAWWAAVYGVAQGQTRLKRLSSSSSKKSVCLHYAGICIDDVRITKGKKEPKFCFY